MLTKTSATIAEIINNSQSKIAGAYAEASKEAEVRSAADPGSEKKDDLIARGAKLAQELANLANIPGETETIEGEAVEDPKLKEHFDAQHAQPDNAMQPKPEGQSGKKEAEENADPEKGKEKKDAEGSEKKEPDSKSDDLPPSEEKKAALKGIATMLAVDDLFKGANSVDYRRLYQAFNSDPNLNKTARSIPWKQVLGYGGTAIGAGAAGAGYGLHRANQVRNQAIEALEMDEMQDRQNLMDVWRRGIQYGAEAMRQRMQPGGGGNE